jgi:hypothetical protein
MQFTSSQIEAVKRLASFGSVYRNTFINHPNFKKQFTDNYTALHCFLETYAYEHQGSAKAYPIIATQTIEKIFNGKVETVSSTHCSEAWQTYQYIAKNDFNELRVNPTHNPMNNYDGVLSIMAQQKVSNLAEYTKNLLEKDGAKKAHEFIDEIKGIGPKIASFYLRDIVCLSGLDENKIQDSFYLQPFDTWLEQAFSLITKNGETSLESKQRTLVELCKVANCSPVAFNQGSWIVGSQIAGDFQSFRRIAFDENSKELIEEYIQEQETLLKEIKKASGLKA